MNTVGKRLQAMRKALNLKPHDITAKTTYSEEYVLKVEADKDPSPDGLIKTIAREFSIREEWLRHGTGSMKKNSQDMVRDKFLNQFNHLIYECNDSAMDEIEDSVAYQAVQQKISDMQESLLPVMPKDKQDLFDEYLNAENEYQSIISKLMFVRGLQFGIHLSKLLAIDSDKNYISMLIDT